MLTYDSSLALFAFIFFHSLKHKIVCGLREEKFSFFPYFLIFESKNFKRKNFTCVLMSNVQAFSSINIWVWMAMGIRLSTTK